LRLTRVLNRSTAVASTSSRPTVAGEIDLPAQFPIDQARSAL
jgi:hypothetical protein